MKKALGVWVLTVAMFGSTMFGLAAEEIVEDFNLNERSAGDLLSGSKVGKSDYIWEATTDVIVGGDANSGYAASADGRLLMGRIPIPDDAKVMTIEGGLRPVAKEDVKAWLSVGLGSSPFFDPATTNVAWGKGIFLLVTADGHFQCLYNPERENNMTGVLMKSGKIEDFDPQGFNKAKIEYDRDRNIVSMWVNDNKVMDRFDIGNAYGFTPKADNIGFSGYGQLSGESLIQGLKFTFSN